MNHVMLVEDEPSIRYVLSELLTDEGFAVTAAPDGAAALGLLAGELRVDAFLVDLFMPAMNGRELVHAIRSIDRFARAPIVLITGAVYRDEDYPAPGTYQALIQKPFDLVDVLETVQRLIHAAATETA